MTERIVERRTMLTLTAGGAGALLTGCVVQAPPAAQPATQPAPPASKAPPATGSKPTQSKQPEQPEQPAEPPLAKLDDVPAGGGIVLADQKLVVTRDAAGKAAAFTAVCTHSGCIVQNVANGTINCGCHGSKFDAGTGAVVNGPAQQPLAGLPVVQRDGAIFRA